MVTNIPQHIAIIMDGNRRWAAQKKLPELEGHRQGVDTLVETVEFALKAGIKYLTVYALSTENYANRSSQEVRGLLQLLEEGARKYLPKLKKVGVRMKFIGKIGLLPLTTKLVLETVTKQLSTGAAGILVVAINYGGREEIIEAATSLVKEKAAINKENLEKFLTTAGIPDPDLIIRTGGQKRLSNFLLWQASYSELFFTETLWPDFNKIEFTQILKNYSQRKRNFGK